MITQSLLMPGNHYGTCTLYQVIASTALTIKSHGVKTGNEATYNSHPITMLPHPQVSLVGMVKQRNALFVSRSLPHDQGCQRHCEGVQCESARGGAWANSGRILPEHLNVSHAPKREDVLHKQFCALEKFCICSMFTNCINSCVIVFR